MDEILRFCRPRLALGSFERWRCLGLALCGLVIVGLADEARAQCTPAGPYNNAGNAVVCNPGVGESLNTLGGTDSVTLESGSLGMVDMGTGNDTFVLNGGIVTTVNQDAPAPATQGNDTAIISGGTLTGTLSQGGGSDSYVHTGGGSVGILDQGGGNDTATVGAGATIGTVLQGSGSDELFITGGSIGVVDQGSFSDSLFMSGGLIGSIDTGTGDDLTEITGGVVTGAVNQGAGVDDFIMSGGQIDSLNQGGDLDFAYISGGVITGLFFAGDYVEFSDGTIGEVNLEAGGNTLIMWGGATIVGNLNSESGIDTYNLFGGTIGGTITTGSNDDVMVIGGVPSQFNGIPIVAPFGATTIAGSVIMEGGNDSLTMLAGAINGSIFMDGGPGNNNALAGDGFNDTVMLLGGTVAGSVFTDSAADNHIGNDVVVIDGAVVAGSIDSDGGDDSITLNSGSVLGSILAGTGSDQIVLAGGSIGGGVDGGADDDNILLSGTLVDGIIRGGDGSDGIELVAGSSSAVEGNDGDDLIVWSSVAASIGTGGLNNGVIDGGSGRDIVVIADAAIDLSAMTLDGGDDVSAADGFVDVLALNSGWSGTLNGSRTRNFEIIYIDGGTVVFEDAAVTVSSDPGIDASLTALAGFPVAYGIMVDNGGTLDASNSLAVNGNVTLRQGTLLAGGSGTGSAFISGQLSNPSGSLVDVSGASPAAGDRLRVGGNYAGGGTIHLDAALDATQVSDVIIIDGIVVSGVTALRVRDVGDGTGSGTGFGPGLGIRLVDVSATGGTSAGQFVLENGPITVNAFTYVLNLESDGIWYLQSALRPIVPALASAPHVIEDIALTFAGTLHERVGEQEHLKGRTGRHGMWARVIAQRSDETADTGILGPLQSKTTLTGLQGGFDLYRWTSQDNSTTHFGVSAGYVDARSRSTSSGVGGATGFEGGIAGVHLTHYARAGWYADAGLYSSWIDVDAVTGDDALGTASRTSLASMEIGYSLPATTGGWQIEPQAQLIYLDRGLDDVIDGPRTWRFNADDSLIGRLGLRLKATSASDSQPDRLVTGYLSANIWDVLSGGQDEMTIGTLPLELHRRGTWADLGLGFSVDAAEGLTIYADGDIAFDVDASDYHALTGKAGVRLNW